jgi:predicted nuclease with TOPRIM domain
LCKVENFIKELKENGMPEMPANAQLVDNSILTSMINRLDALEKKEIGSNEKIKQLEKELSDLTRETGEKFADLETALIEIEKQLPEPDSIEYDVTEDVLSLSADIITDDLKTLVENELTVEDVST